MNAPKTPKAVSRAEQAQAIEERLRKLMELLPLSVSMSDANGNLILGVDSVGRFWCGDVAEGPERFSHFKGWWVADGRPVERDEWPVLRALHHGETRLNDEIEIECFDGTRKVMRTWATPVRSKDGRITGVISVNEDITARKAIEARATADHLRLQKLIEVLPVGVWVADERGTIVMGNEAGRRIWAGARYVGMASLGEYKGWWPDGRQIEAHEWPLARAVTHGETRVNDEIEIECFDGTRKTILNSALPLHAEDGRLLGALVTNEDITERRRAAHALEASERRFRALVEKAEDGILLVDRNLTILYRSPGATRITGFSDGERLGGRFGAAIHEDDREGIVGIVQSLSDAAIGTVAAFRCRVAGKAGATRWVEGVVTNLLHDPAVGALVVNIRDIDESVRAERALRESNERFNIVARATNDAVWDWDLLTNRVVWNAGYQTLFGYSREETQPGAESWYDYIHPEDADATIGSIHEVIDGGGQAWSAEYRFRRKDGTYADVFDRGFVVRDGDGRAVRMIGAMMDISARTAAESAVRRLTRMHAALSALSEAVTKVQGEQELFQNVCDIAVSSGDFVRAIVRTVNARGELAVAALSGDGAADFARLVLPVDRGQSLVGEAVRTGQTVICTDFQNDPRTHAVREKVRNAAGRSVGVFPLRQGGNCIGALVLRGKEGDAFEGDMRALLERMAATVSFGLDHLASERARREADKSLRESEARFRSLVELSNDWYWEQDAEFRFTRFEGARASPFLAAAIGKKRWDIPSNVPLTTTWDEHRAVLEAHQPFRGWQCMRVMHDGGLRFFEVSGEPIFGAEGVFRGYRGVASDVTDRVRGERLLRLEHAVAKELADARSMSDGLRNVIRVVCETKGWSVGRFYEPDEDGTLRFFEGWGIADPVVEQYLALSRDMAYRPGEGITGYVWERGEPVWVSNVAKDSRASRRLCQYVSGGAMVIPVLAGSRALGVLSFVRADPTAPDEKLLYALQVIASQVGEFIERKRAEAVLRESEARFRGLVEISSDWYWEQDEELRFTRLEGAVTEKSGNAPNQALGKRRWEIADIRPLSHTWEEHRAILEERRPFRHFEYSRIGDDGQVRYVEVSGEPVFDAEGRFRGYRGVASEITPRRLLQQERERVSRFYGTLSALNELVARAQNAAELLQGACEIAVASADFQYALVRIVDEARGVADMVAFAGESSGAWIDRPLSLDPHSPDSEALSLVAYRTGERAVAVGDRLTGRRLFGALTEKNGTHSAGSYPLKRGGKCVGALLLNSRDARAFDGEMGDLLGRVARNISDALDRLDAREALGRFRLALDHSADMMVLIDPIVMRLVDVNDTMCRQLGYAREELLALPLSALLPLSIQELQSQYQALLANPAMTGNLRSHYRRKDGSIIPIESTRRVLRSGGRSLIVEISRDIRERLAAEQELRQKDAYFRSLIENVSDAIAATDKTWRFLYVSPSIATLTGYTAEELIGKEFGSTTTLGDIAAVRERLAAALERSGEPQRVRVEMIRKDGELRVHDLVVSKGAGPGGDPIYIIAGRDVTDWIRAEEALRRSAEEFRTLAENAPDGFLRFDDELRCLFANSAILKSSGRSMGALLGRTLREIALPEELRRLWAEAIRRVLATGETQTVEYRYHGSRGEREYQARFAAERGPDGKPATVLVISRDITDRKRAERAIAESEARLRSIVEASAEPLLLVDPDGTMLFANPAAASLFDRPLEKLQGTPLGLPLGHGRPVDVEIMLPGGHVRPVEMQFAPTELNGKPMLVVSLHDLSERKHYEKHIEHLANHDGLTGLPNRTLLRDRVAQVISHARRTNGHVGLMFVDLDHFKLVNDSWGHVAGDMLLLEVARRLQLATRDGDTVARLGGDEFVVLLPDLARPDDIAVVARKLADALEEPIDVDGRSVRVTASIGISTFPGDGDDLESLLQCADAAMYRAKDAGRNGYQYYSAEMSAQARVRVETENGLRQALQQSELRLHFQPQLSFADGKVQGFEALMRWERPSHGMVPPAQFIPVAEESGLIMPMGQWALHTACREAMAWSSAGLGKLKVAVNLSARQFWRGSVTDVVRAALAESGLPPEQLELEITESVVARDLKQVMLSLEHLRRMGITIAIDDFGTGYSSLAYLRSLPIDKLKIDKSFIAGIPVDPEASALVGEIIRLAHVLSLEVVAEGVETAGQAAFLRDAGCEAMQGFFFSRPLAADDCATLLRSARCLQLDPPGP